MTLNIDTARSYKTEDNLMKAMKSFGIEASDRALVVCNRAGRFTAIFPASSCKGDMTRFARLDFITLG